MFGVYEGEEVWYEFKDWLINACHSEGNEEYSTQQFIIYAIYDKHLLPHLPHSHAQINFHTFITYLMTDRVVKFCSLSW